MSCSAYLTNDGCWNLTANSLHLCTWARDPVPIGILSMPLNNSDSGFPVSSLTMSPMLAKSDWGHLSCKTLRVLMYSSGTKYTNDDICCPILMYTPLLCSAIFNNSFAPLKCNS
eukprot:NODE_110_length_19453_cov_0.364369.p13 type:complete len:114 gc:universal NODE_110_length_19453_cov_0.364369:12616-12275(-)